MTFGIIDKNPRKPRKEGVKAQLKYCEDLQTEWIDNHALSNLPTTDTERPTPDVVARYQRLEDETRERVAAELSVQRTKYEAMCRVDVLARKAAWETATFGALRKDTRDEMLGLGMDPEELCPSPRDLASKAAWEVRVLGTLREDTRDEMLELGMDPEELCPSPSEPD